jgi:Holliday junction resolvase RusA-like endonuclease
MTGAALAAGARSPTIVLHVSTPISANRMFTRQMTRRGHRDLTPEYKTWRDAAGWDARRQLVGVPEITCRFDVVIEVPETRGDVDNLIKSALDLCQLSHAISNDANAASVSISQRPGRDGCMIAITPRPELGGIRAAAKIVHRRSAPRAKQRKGGITSAMLVGLGR